MYAGLLEMHRDFPVRCEGNEGSCWGLERAKSGGSGGLGGENRIRGRIGREEEKGNHRGRAPLFYAAWLAFTLALALAGLGANDWETGTSTQSQSLSLSSLGVPSDATDSSKLLTGSRTLSRDASGGRSSPRPRVRGG